MNLDVLSTLTGLTIKEPRTVIDRGFIGNDQATANCLIKTFDIYSICKGLVLAVEQEPKTNHWCVTVETAPQKWIRYRSMASAKVKVGQSISKDTFVGYGYKGMMRFEYCNSKQSQFPVRILDKQLYKQDPSSILFGQENPEEVF